MPRVARGFDVDAARRHLRRADPELGLWMRRLDKLPADPNWHRPFDTVDALARAILYQQLHGRAAATIVARVEAAIVGAGGGSGRKGPTRLDAAALGLVDDAQLRGCGVSGNKTRALRDLALRAAAGEIPSSRRMAFLADEEIIQRLVAVRGIGRWTVEMMLIFRLGRPDVLPVDDFGIRKGLQVLDGLEQMPPPRSLRQRGERWSPFSSYASLCLWRIADQASAAATPVPRSQST